MKQTLTHRLKSQPGTWLVSGAAGFIGSHLVEALLKRDQRVKGLDNFATGKQENLEHVQAGVLREQWARFSFLEASIEEWAACQRACVGADYVLHQAALGSVPRSVVDPLASHQSNVTGFINMLNAAREAGAKRFVYASSSAVYGDEPDLPKRESRIGQPLSPYAATKLMNELYAGVFARCYHFPCIGLRYFNVFGPRQDPEGPYAAVIPKWIEAMMTGTTLQINGDGETSRDFCYVANVVQVNLLAALVQRPEAVNQVYNVALGSRTTLNHLFEMLRTRLLPHFPTLEQLQPRYGEFRAGDVRHSQADISKARDLLGYQPTHDIAQGLDEALPWYMENVKCQSHNIKSV
jgi:UDP-N-acetylglucosamine 4-epimerase